MESKEAFRAQIEAQLKEWNERLDELKGKAEKASADLKAEYDKDIKLLTAKSKELQQQLKEFIATSDDAWKILRKGMEKAAADLKTAFSKARKKFK